MEIVPRSMSASAFYLLDDGDLPQVSGGATLYQRDVCGQTHPVHMVTGGYGERRGFHVIIMRCQKSGTFLSFKK